jgi:hypothetical protein
MLLKAVDVRRVISRQRMFGRIENGKSAIRESWEVEKHEKLETYIDGVVRAMHSLQHCGFIKDREHVSLHCVAWHCQFGQLASPTGMVNDD